MIDNYFLVKVQRNGNLLAQSDAIPYKASEMFNISVEIKNITRPRINANGSYGV